MQRSLTSLLLYGFAFLQILIDTGNGAGISEIIFRRKPQKVTQQEFLFQLREYLTDSNQLHSPSSVPDISPIFRQAGESQTVFSRFIYKITGVETNNMQEMLDKLENHPDILWAEPNQVFQIHYTPNDSLYSLQWALHQIEMPRAWDIERGNSDIIIGVIDTGIDYYHQDLKTQLWINQQEDLNGNGQFDAADINFIDEDQNGYADDVIGWDFTDAPAFPDNGDFLHPDNDPMDEFPGGHGTPVSGIIAAATDNFHGIAGMAPGAKIMTLRAGTSSGFLEEDDVAEAILYAVANGCRIVNMSFGDVVYSHLIKDAVEYGKKNGLIFVASAGNDGNDILHFPAGYNETISVSATDNQSDPAPFTSYGSKTTVSAPGQSIMSTSPNQTYGEFSGTSFAAPMVSGLLALLWSQDPQAAPELISSRLITGSQDRGSPGWDPYYGNGLINAFQCLTVNNSIIASIISPITSGGTSSANIPIIGIAAGAGFREYTLAYGYGKNPLSVDVFYRSANQVYRDTLGFWDGRTIPDSVYTIELTVYEWSGSSFTDRVIFYLDRTTPAVSKLDQLPMLVEDKKGVLIELETDDLTVVTLHYRKQGEIEFDHLITSGYFTQDHQFLLTHPDIRQNIEYFLEIENNSGLAIIDDNGGQYYQVDLSSGPLLSENFRLVDEIPGFGLFMAESTDLAGDGQPDLIGNVRWPEFPGSRISFVGLDAENHLVREIGPIPAIGRDIMDFDHDSYPELLAGYGAISYLFPELGNPDQPFHFVQANLVDFWAARFMNSQLSDQVKILAIHQNQWQLFALNSLEQFEVISLQTLTNPSDGGNMYGVPFAEVLDINKNGRMDAVIGDYDGDLLIFEESDSGLLEPLTWKRLGGIDATHHFATGDVNGDGIHEIVIATQKLAEYTGESSQLKQYWILNVLQLEGNALKVLDEKYIHGVFDQNGTQSGVTVSDFDSDGLDEIFFTPYPRAYYFDYEGGIYHLKWYLDHVNCNAVPRLEDNKFLLVTDSTLMMWERRAIVERPGAPEALWISQADSSSVHLHWMTVSGAEQYQITRTAPGGEETLIFYRSENVLVDTLVARGSIYTYHVRTVDSLFQIPLSAPSESVTVKAQNPPELIEFSIDGQNQFLLAFDGRLGKNSLKSEKFWIEPGLIRPGSIVRGKNYNQILLTLLTPLEPGTYQLSMHRLTNEYNIPFYTDTHRVEFTIPEPQNTPYLERIEMVSKKHLRLFFSHPMSVSSFENIENFEIEPDDRIIETKLDESDPSIGHVFLTGQNRMGSLGVEYYLKISELSDIWGMSIDPQQENRFLIRKLAQNLDEVVVFPNPLRSGSNEEGLNFGNLPQGSHIYIYTSSGKNVITLENNGFTGGIQWNMRNDKGDEIRNGVYMFLVVYGDQQKSGKFIILK